MKCKLCNEGLSFRWTDTHGVGVCTSCGLPYQVFHYGEDNNRIDKEPEVAIKPEWLPLAKKYYAETKAMVFPASYDMGILSSRGSSYSGATASSIESWVDWLDTHEDEIPRQIDKEES